MEDQDTFGKNELLNQTDLKFNRNQKSITLITFLGRN